MGVRDSLHLCPQVSLNITDVPQQLRKVVQPEGDYDHDQQLGPLRPTPHVDVGGDQQRHRPTQCSEGVLDVPILLNPRQTWPSSPRHRYAVEVHQHVDRQGVDQEAPSSPQRQTDTHHAGHHTNRQRHLQVSEEVAFGVIVDSVLVTVSDLVVDIADHYRRGNHDVVLPVER